MHRSLDLYSFFTAAKNSVLAFAWSSMAQVRTVLLLRGCEPQIAQFGFPDTFFELRLQVYKLVAALLRLDP